MPTLVSTPAPTRFLDRFNATHVQRSAQRCAEVAQQRPTWPQSRVRALVARELNVSTRQLRYLLRQAGSQPQPTPDADTPSLAA
jgi:transposase